jgi:hypothetical protein
LLVQFQMHSTARILIVDDQASVRDGIRAFIELNTQNLLHKGRPFILRRVTGQVSDWDCLESWCGGQPFPAFGNSWGGGCHGFKE